MELPKEFITEHNLTEQAVQAINGLNASTIAELKKSWDGKANADANAILDGATKKVSEITGLQRAEGQKIADYIESAWQHHSTSKSSELANLKADYESKIKSVGGSEALTKEYEALKDRVENHYKKIEVDYEATKPFKEKYEAQNQELTKFKIDLAFNSNKPNFPDTVNAYESTAKWNEFKSEVLDKYTIEIVNGEAKAINKDNKHDIVKLKDLVTHNENLNSLLKEREQKGIPTKEAKLADVEGVPFKVPANATSKEIGGLVKAHLTSKGLGMQTRAYSDEYAKLYSKIKNR
tara:strand:- start:28939 stop:29817 length:879 start_codon:yes stop_codon:yes gene_type:complete